MALAVKRNTTFYVLSVPKMEFMVSNANIVQSWLERLFLIHIFNFNQNIDLWYRMRYHKE